MQMMPSLFLLEKTIVNVEGLGRQLYPELDLWSTLAPYFEQWSKDRYSPKSIIKKLRDIGPNWLEQFPEVPPLLFKALQQLANPPQVTPIEKKASRTSVGAGLWLAAIGGITLGLLLPELPSPESLRDLGIATLALIGAYALVRR